MTGFRHDHATGTGVGGKAEHEIPGRQTWQHLDDYLARHLDRPDGEPERKNAEQVEWTRYMSRDCLHIASAIAIETGLPVGRLMKRGQLAHAFVILPNRLCSIEQGACLDWIGVRTIGRMRLDLRGTWGRLVLDADRTPIEPDAGALAEALGRPHMAEALKLFATKRD